MLYEKALISCAWIFLKIVRFFTFPFYLIKSCQQRKICVPIKNNLLLLPASAIAQKIRNREITSPQVMRAYIERIVEVNPLLNAVVDDRFQEALLEAEQVETILNSSLSMTELEKNYPLLGVPVTIKGSIAVEGLNHSAGVLLRNKKAFKDANTVRRLREAGAIPILVSNTPEFCLNWETTNKLIGTTRNPYDSRKTVGGSSGGEAALLSSGASLIGLGSDIAGSLRLPSHFCGIYGHKPSPRTTSVIGHYPDCHEEDWPDVFQIGPMSRYASDLSMLFEIIVDPAARDKLVAPVDLKKLKVFYLKQINSPLVCRINRDTENAIEKITQHFNNYTESSVCKEVNIELFKYSAQCSYLRLLMMDNIDNLFQGKGEGSLMELLRFFFCLSKSVFTTIAYGVMKRLEWAIPKGYKQLMMDRLATLKKELLEILDEESVLIMPIFTKEATFHGEMIKRVFDYGYCSILNALGLPATACPVMQTSRGMPIGIQIVGAPNCDRLCLAVAQEIEKAFGGWRPPSASIGKLDEKCETA